MSEQNEIQQLFFLHFAEFKNNKIVLYGVGANTKAILDCAEEFNIIGLMDSRLSGEKLWGKEILSEEQVVERNADMIVIIANPISVKIIYRRIQSFAKKNGIFVFDINGRDQSYLDKTEPCTPNPYFQADEQMLRRIIDQHDVISFDIFDTLLMRKTLFPTDVFELVEAGIRRSGRTENEFARVRIKAERVLSASVDPTFDEIYDRIADELKLENWEKEEWKALERGVETLLLEPRTKMCELYEYARQSGKKIYLTSDMYFSSKDLKQFLSVCGIAGYEKLLVSCEYRMTKKQGLLLALREEACKAYSRDCRILHIGDHPDADISAGKAAGISTFYVMSGRDMMEHTTVHFPVRDGDNLNDRIAEGLFVQKVFRDPFALCRTNRRIELCSAYDMSYCCAAPVITTYMFWLWRQLQKHTIDTVLFAARDGYLLKQLFELMVRHDQVEKPPQAIYFMTSRSAAVLAGIKDENDILQAVEGFSGVPEELLEERFHLKKEEILPYGGRSTEDFQAYIMRHKDKILKLAKEERENSRVYIDSRLGPGNHRLAFVDLMSKGTCQKSFTAITGRNIVGLYFYYRNMKIQNPEKDITVYALYGQNSNFYRGDEAFSTKFPLLEILLSSPDPTLRCFKPDGSPVYEEERRSGEQIALMMEMQRAVKDYFQSFLAIKGECVDDGMTLNYADWALSVLDRSYVQIRDERINGLIFDNRYEGRDTWFGEIIG